MKKAVSIAVLGFFLAVTNAGASLNSETNPNYKSSKTDSQGVEHFRELEALYAKAESTNADEMTGWFSGRCFWKMNNYQTENVIFMGWGEARDGGTCPYRQKEVFKGLYAGNGAQSADYFDNLTQQKEQLVNNYLTHAKSSAIESYIEDDALVTGVKDNDSRWHTRRSDDVFVMQMTAMNEVRAYCYLFKKLKW